MCHHTATNAPQCTECDDKIVRHAIHLLEQRLFCVGPKLNQPEDVTAYLQLKLIAEPSEVFAVIFCNSQDQVLAYEPLFRGSITKTTVHPRVVVQRALSLNAASVVLSHQHPSGNVEPSAEDRLLTSQLVTALSLIDVRVLDHIIVGNGAPYSFARAGLL